MANDHVRECAALCRHELAKTVAPRNRFAAAWSHWDLDLQLDSLDANQRVIYREIMDNAGLPSVFVTAH